MNKSPLTLALALAVAACAGTPAAVEGAPAWLNSPQENCGAASLCALGSGSTLAAAQADAQAQMLKTFENSITAVTSVSQTQEAQQAADQVRSAAAGVIGGVEVKETWRDEKTGAFYARARLNRLKAAAVLKGDIDAADAKMKALLAAGTPAAARELRQIYAYRDGLNRRYAFLNGGQGAAEVVPYAAAYGNATASRGKVSATYRLPAGLPSAEFAKALTDNGYQVMASADSALAVEVEVSDLHMAVSGFIKRSYTLSAKRTGDGGKTAVLTTTVEATGRSEADCLAKARPLLVKYLADHLDELDF
ncbi:hypothetical protein FACS1894186_0920 [Alphaproteobacteria bacterium]|nr:hypothetical protein FACS1894186_0920 [Alphaproteobacteria bacterium]